MSAATTTPLPAAISSLPEQRMLISNVSWRDYVIMRAALDRPSLRMTYCEGVLELMTTSREHERWKTMIARLIEAYALERDVALFSYGSTTFQNEAKERGAEADACYRVGRPMKDGEKPDLVIEVIHRSPLLDKLEVYRGLEVPEVWMFEDGAFLLHHLKKGGRSYEPIKKSRFLPDLDLTLVARLALREDQHDALRELVAAVRASRKSSHGQPKSRAVKRARHH